MAKKPEIERRWLSLPGLVMGALQSDWIDIQQYYVDQDGEVVRYREVTMPHGATHYFRTVKTGVGRDRDEDEVRSEAETYLWYLPNRTGNIIQKRRYTVQSIFIDVYRGELEGLIIIEREFENSIEAEMYEAPAWFGREITDDVRFSNVRLARYGQPLIVSWARTFEVTQPRITVAELGDWVRAVILPHSHGARRQLTSVAGGTATGKSTKVTTELARLIPDNGVLNIDGYYIGNELMETLGVTHWDDPRAVDLSLVEQHVIQLLRGETVDMPIYSFKEGRRVGTRPFGPFQQYIADGLFALYPELLWHADYSIFVHASTHAQLLRRLSRDLERTSMTAKEIIDYFINVVHAAHVRYVQSTARRADVVVDNEMNPDLEAQRLQLAARQLKFEQAVDLTLLRGAERISASIQEDQYFVAPDRREILRIRNEAEEWTLAYKAPFDDASKTQRRSMVVPIDASTADALKGLYRLTLRKVRKHRTVYLFDGVMVCCDVLPCDQNHAHRYTELRGATPDTTEQELLRRATRLGLSEQKIIRKSYADI